MPERPPAWLLSPGDPRLCPGVGEPCLYDACYRRTTCRVCGAGTSADAAPWAVGGGRVGQHYPLDPPRPWAPPARVRIPATAPVDHELPGQLTLGLADG